jgi:hypothetical protein
VTRNGAGELAVTDAQWAADRSGLSLGNGPRFEMYVYVEDLDATLTRLVEASVEVLREAEDMPWGERIATIADPGRQPRCSLPGEVDDPLPSSAPHEHPAFSWPSTISRDVAATDCNQEIGTALPRNPCEARSNGSSHSAFLDRARVSDPEGPVTSL